VAEGADAKADDDEAAAGGGDESPSGQRQRQTSEAGEDDDDERSSASEEDDDAESLGSPSGSPSGGRAKPRFTAEKRRDFEARQALRTMLEAVRMLRCANTEVIRLQRMARAVHEEQGPAAARPPAPSPGPRRERAFLLLTEFLDEASIDFQRAMKDALPNWVGEFELTGEFEESFKREVLLAAEGCFRFVVKSDARLAVPLDPRSQALRAAVALEEGAVQYIFREQVGRRLRDALMSVLMEAACSDEDEFTMPDLADMQSAASSALQEVQVLLQEALERLTTGLQDRSA